MAPQSKGGLKLQTIEHYEGQFPNNQKILYMLFYYY
jgi:hypothetical protein